MPAWKHTTQWNDNQYKKYRNYVQSEAPKFRGHEGLDCADLSMILLINFASDKGLPVTFIDNDGRTYSSAGKQPSPPRFWTSWENKEEYVDVVVDRIGTESLWRHNTVTNKAGPEPGDLLMAWEDAAAGLHHTALVYKVYPKGTPHPHQGRNDIKDYSNNDQMKRESNTEYFRDRDADSDTHFDYLNYRSRKKDKAELIYFAKVSDIKEDGLQFRKWSQLVLNHKPLQGRMEGREGNREYHPPGGGGRIPEY